MAFGNPKDNLPGMLSAGDLSLDRYKFMVIDSNGKVARNTTAGGIVDGILQDNPAAAGRPCSVAVAGISKCASGAVINPGDLVASNEFGLAVLPAIGDFVRGRALTGAGGSGELFTVHLAFGFKS